MTSILNKSDRRTKSDVNLLSVQTTKLIAWRFVDLSRNRFDLYKRFAAEFSYLKDLTYFSLA